MKNYGRNQKERKEYIYQSGLLMTGKDVVIEQHDTCIGILEGVRCRNAWVMVYNISIIFGWVWVAEPFYVINQSLQIT